MERVVTPTKKPQEGDLVKDALTGKNMFFRFGKWTEITDKEVEMINKYAPLIRKER